MKNIFLKSCFAVLTLSFLLRQESAAVSNFGPLDFTVETYCGQLVDPDSPSKTTFEKLLSSLKLSQPIQTNVQSTSSNIFSLKYTKRLTLKPLNLYLHKYSAGALFVSVCRKQNIPHISSEDPHSTVSCS
jgi:hypothetical protein